MLFFRLFFFFFRFDFFSPTAPPRTLGPSVAADAEGSVSPPRNDSTALRLSPNGALRGNDDVEVAAAEASGREEEHGGCGDAEDDAPTTIAAAAAADRTADPRRLLAGLMATNERKQK